MDYCIGVAFLDQGTVSFISRNFIRCGWPQGWHARNTIVVGKTSRSSIQKLCMSPHDMKDHGRSYMRSLAVCYNLRSLVDFSRPLFAAFCQVPHRPWRSRMESLFCKFKRLHWNYKDRKMKHKINIPHHRITVDMKHWAIIMHIDITESGGDSDYFVETNLFINK